MLSKHNIHFNLNLMRKVQEAISANNLETFARGFVADWFLEQEKPYWVDTALNLAFK